MGIRTSNRLNQHSIPKLGPGRHPDGNGLYLYVKPSGTRSWMMRITVHRARRDIGLGPYPLVSLRDARTEAQRIRQVVFEGGDPLVERREAEQVPTFAEAAEIVWNNQKVAYMSEKHIKQWISALRTYTFEEFGNVKVSDVTSKHVTRALTPIWNTKAETASRVLQRIGTVIKWAKATDHYSGDNPIEDARTALGPQAVKVKHHPALPWQKLLAFMSRLQEREGLSALALQFIILTAARSGEARMARWEEIDIAEKLWTVPAERMKMKREHRVPLSDAALDLLRIAGGERFLSAGLIFPNSKNKALSDSVFRRLFKRMDVKDITTHGFRTTFKDWCREETDYSFDVSEMALAHVERSETVRAYARSDLLARRRVLMDDWAAYAVGENLPDVSTGKLSETGKR